MVNIIFGSIHDTSLPSSLNTLTAGIHVVEVDFENVAVASVLTLACADHQPHLAPNTEGDILDTRFFYCETLFNATEDTFYEICYVGILKHKGNIAT